MKPRPRPRGGSFKKGSDFKAVAQMTTEGHRLRPRRTGGRRTPRPRGEPPPTVSPFNDPTLLGQSVPAVPPKTVLQLEQELRVATGQRDAALKALNDRTNVEQILHEHDRLIAAIGRGMQSLRKTCRLIIQLAEEL